MMTVTTAPCGGTGEHFLLIPINDATSIPVDGAEEGHYHDAYTHNVSVEFPEAFG